MDLIAPLEASGAGMDEPAPRGGFWLRSEDAGLRLSELAARGWALQLACSECGRQRLWASRELAGLPDGATLGMLAARLVCGAVGCGSQRGTLAVLRPPGRRRAARRRLSDRDVARIKALAEEVTETYAPPVLDDLDAPIRVGACLPGQEIHAGAQVAIPWRGRLILAWTLGRKARNRRRARDAPLA